MQPKRNKGVKGLSCGKGMTVQKPDVMTNINEIMEKSQKGMIPLNSPLLNSGKIAMYGDFSMPQTYEDVQNRIIEVQNEFLALPSDIRELFENNPANLLDALASNDAEVQASLAELGLIELAENTPKQPSQQAEEKVEETPEEPKTD